MRIGIASDSAEKKKRRERMEMETYYYYYILLLYLYILYTYRDGRTGALRLIFYIHLSVRIYVADRFVTEQRIVTEGNSNTCTVWDSPITSYWVHETMKQLVRAPGTFESLWSPLVSDVITGLFKELVQERRYGSEPIG